MSDIDKALMLATIAGVAAIVLVTIGFFGMDILLRIDELIYSWQYERMQAAQRRVMATGIGDYVVGDEGCDLIGSGGAQEPLPNAVPGGLEPSGTNTPEPVPAVSEPRDIIKMTRPILVAELARVIITNDDGTESFLTHAVIAQCAGMRKADVGDIIREVRNVEKKPQPEPYQFEEVAPNRFKRIDVKE